MKKMIMMVAAIATVAFFAACNNTPAEEQVTDTIAPEEQIAEEMVDTIAVTEEVAEPVCTEAKTCDKKCTKTCDKKETKTCDKKDTKSADETKNVIVEEAKKVDNAVRSANAVAQQEAKATVQTVKEAQNAAAATPKAGEKKERSNRR